MAEKKEQGAEGYSRDEVRRLEREIELEPGNRFACRPIVTAGECEGICQNCHQAYGVWFVPNEVWNEVIAERVGMLCPNCFINRAERQGFKTTGWKLAPEAYCDATQRQLPVSEEQLQKARQIMVITLKSAEAGYMTGLLDYVKLAYPEFLGTLNGAAPAHPQGADSGEKEKSR